MCRYSMVKMSRNSVVIRFSQKTRYRTVTKGIYFLARTLQYKGLTIYLMQIYMVSVLRRFNELMIMFGHFRIFLLIFTSYLPSGRKDGSRVREEESLT